MDGTTNTDPTGQGKTFTQAELDKIIADRLARAKSTVPDDYEELKAKAAELDAIKESNKTELQKATERAAELQSQIDSMKAAAERSAKVSELAKKHGVNADLLAKMSGDVEENASFLASMSENGNQKRYPQTRDAGDVVTSSTANPAAEAARMLFSRNKE